MYIADTLSRVYLTRNPKDSQKFDTEREEESIHAIDYQAISEQQLSEIKLETAKDPTLQILKQVILRGWPKTVRYQKKSPSTSILEKKWPYRTEPSLKAKDVLFPRL